MFAETRRTSFALLDPSGALKRAMPWDFQKGNFSLDTFL
jgi:hypothetical protein